MEQAFKAIDNCQPELAAAFFDRALTLDPDNADLLDEYSELLLANDNVTKASRLLQQSIAGESSHDRPSFFFSSSNTRC